MRRFALVTVAAVSVLLTGCDMIGGALGIESPEKTAAVREADGKAIGGACRHAGRAIEDCFALNRKADKAAIFAGWRDMNDYMRENKIDPVMPQVAAQLTRAKPAPAEADGAQAVPKAAPGGQSHGREDSKSHDS